MQALLELKVDLDSEDRRLQALRSYDTVRGQPARIFDELARMASAVCDTPIALVSFVEDTQQCFMAAIGLDLEQTRREDSFCTHAIRGIEPFIVADTFADARFSANPLVVGSPNIRFYAGAPLITADGCALGTLCVADSKPRKLTAQQIEALTLLAQNVMAQLDLRKTVLDLTTANAVHKRIIHESEAAQKSLGERIERQRELLDHNARHHPETGLPNLSAFIERLTRGVDNPRSSSLMTTVILIDMQRYELLVESLDERTVHGLLKDIAQRLHEVFGPDATIAHVEADRFAVYSQEWGSPRIAAAFLEALLLPALAKPFTAQSQELRLAFRVGLAQSAGVPDAESLLRRARVALLKAKDGNMRYQLYTAALEANSGERLSLETRLRRAFDHEQLELHYQPKVSLATGTICGVEALLRWPDPSSSALLQPDERQWIPPALFVPVLESTGMLIEVGRWIIERAQSDFFSWQLQGLTAPRIAVNVSPMQLRDRHFLSDMEERLNATSSKLLLDVELTEAVLMEKPEQCIEILATLRAWGVRVAIDDFGTGYSSLRYLAKLPVDALKIDMSFVHAMLNGPDHTAIVSSVIALAHNLRLVTVAEGVETQEQRNLLHLLRCDQMQGYLFSKAVDADALADMLGAQDRTVVR